MGRAMAFTGAGLDRADNLRADPAAIADLRARPDARIVGLTGLSPDCEGTALSLRAVPGDAGDLVFLGLRDGAPLFAAVNGAGDARGALEQKADLRLLAQLDGGDLALYGLARSLVDWHGRHRFCANCGAATEQAKGGWQRSCPDCGAQHFPRVDPVAITLVEHDGALLLARGQGWPRQTYSALAGFIEPGESVEEGTAREVLEETGLAITNVTYIASQPWPFPSQLMIGCHAFARSRKIVLDEMELADARWFTRAEIARHWAAGRQAELHLASNPAAIAHVLVKWWMEKTA